jgi:hypothetical protein
MSLEDYHLDTIEHGDALIEELQRRILMIQYSRNALTPICRLPDELLLRIFRFLQNTAYEAEETQRIKSLPLDQLCLGRCLDDHWHRVSWVCRRLRRIALDAPELWSTFENTDGLLHTSALWRTVCFERTGGLPLTIYWARSQWQKTEIEWWAPKIKRAKSAYLDLTMADGKTLEYLVESLPNLLSLHVRFASSIWSDQQFLGGNFLGGNGTRLTHLTLEGIEVRDPPEFPRLIYLHLRRWRMDSSHKDHNYHTILRRTPRLQLARFQSFTTDPFEMDVLSDVVQPLLLPDLREVDVHLAEVRYLHSFLRTIPATIQRAKIVLSNDAYYDIDDTKLHLLVLRQLQELCVGRPETEHHAILVNAKLFLNATGRGFTTSVFINAGAQNGRPDVDVHMSWAQLSPDIQAYLPLVQTFEIDANAADSFFTYHHLWTESFLLLETLVICGFHGADSWEWHEDIFDACLSWLGKLAEKPGHMVNTVVLRECSHDMKAHILPFFVHHASSRGKKVFNTVAWQPEVGPNELWHCMDEGYID